MTPWIDFILERYNYWIVIVLMMIGLYTVFARGNLVKKVVGLNVFQTSVFIFYITIGKIAGGTAPIYMGGELDHGGGHGDAGEGHGADAGHGVEDAAHDAPADQHGAESLHGKVENAALGDAPVNDLKAAAQAQPETGADAPSLHDAPVSDALVSDVGKIGNDALMDAAKPSGPEFDVAGEHASDAASDAAHGAGEAAHGAAEIIYSNPLPHVLILTAIVVGVATTAVGLALAVRIREAYGTIEEDELEAQDNVAEFGAGDQAGASA